MSTHLDPCTRLEVYLVNSKKALCCSRGLNAEHQESRIRLHFWRQEAHIHLASLIISVSSPPECRKIDSGSNETTVLSVISTAEDQELIITVSHLVYRSLMTARRLMKSYSCARSLRATMPVVSLPSDHTGQVIALVVGKISCRFAVFSARYERTFDHEGMI